MKATNRWQTRWGGEGGRDNDPLVCWYSMRGLKTSSSECTVDSLCKSIKPLDSILFEAGIATWVTAPKGTGPSERRSSVLMHLAATCPVISVWLHCYRLMCNSNWQWFVCLHCNCSSLEMQICCLLSSCPLPTSNQVSRVISLVCVHVYLSQQSWFSV